MVMKKCQTCDEEFETKGNAKRCDYCRGLKQREPRVEPPKGFQHIWGIVKGLGDKFKNSGEIQTTINKGYHPNSVLIPSPTGHETFDYHIDDIKNPYSTSPFKPLESKRDERRKLRWMSE